ncbi:hypothetical protein HDV57DRAFT_525754 [Trichoderma longibrachiatum]
MCISFETVSNAGNVPVKSASGRSALYATEQEWETIQQKVEDGQAITSPELVAFTKIPAFDMRIMVAPKARNLLVRTARQNLKDLEAAGYITIKAPLKVGKDGMLDAERRPPLPEEYQARMLFAHRSTVDDPAPQSDARYAIWVLERTISEILEGRGFVSHSEWGVLERELASRKADRKRRTYWELDRAVETALNSENDDWNLILKTKAYAAQPPSALPLDKSDLRKTIHALMRLCGVPSEEADTLSTSPEDVDSTIRRYLEPHVPDGHSILNIRLFSYYLHQRIDPQFKQHRKFEKTLYLIVKKACAR